MKPTQRIKVTLNNQSTSLVERLINLITDAQAQALKPPYWNEVARAMLAELRALPKTETFSEAQLVMAMELTEPDSEWPFELGPNKERIAAIIARIRGGE